MSSERKVCSDSEVMGVSWKRPGIMYWSERSADSI